MKNEERGTQSIQKSANPENESSRYISIIAFVIPPPSAHGVCSLTGSLRVLRAAKGVHHSSLSPYSSSISIVISIVSSPSSPPLPSDLFPGLSSLE